MPGRSRKQQIEGFIQKLKENEKDPKPKKKDYFTDLPKYRPDPWRDIIFRETSTMNMYVKCPKGCKNPFLVASWAMIEPNFYQQWWVQEVRIMLSSNKHTSKGFQCSCSECKEGNCMLLPGENSSEKVMITCPQCLHTIKLDKVAKEVPDIERAVLPFEWSTNIPRVRVGLER